MTDDAHTQPTGDAPDKRDTSLLDDKILRPLMPDGEQGTRVQTARLAAPWRLLLQIGGENQTTVGIEVRDRVTLGRGDPVASFYPDLDLSPYGGQEGGVSRRHAAIIQDEENKALYLEDLNSTNGTRINGFSLEPRRRYRLRDGDELEFGRVRMILRFVRSPYK
jgi:pSer/pThr/pTyr-binding forkhead associated (FHA) protein